MFNWFEKPSADDKKYENLVRRLEIIERRVNSHGVDIRRLIRDVVNTACKDNGKPVAFDIVPPKVLPGRPRKQKAK